MDLWIPGAASIELIIGIFFLIPILIVENIFIWNIAGSLQALVNGHRQQGRGGVTSYLGNAKIYGGLFLLHLQWQSVSSHRVLKLTQQFGGIGGAIGYPLLSSCQCPPGGRALLMKPLQQPIARDCLLIDDSVSSLSPLFIDDISTHHQYPCSPATETQPVEKHFQVQSNVFDIAKVQRISACQKSSPGHQLTLSETLPFPPQLLSHWDKDQSFFISSSRHYQPPKPLASAYNEVTTGWSLYIYVERIFYFNLEVNQKHCQRQNGLRARVLFQSGSINEKKKNYSWPSICYHFSTKL